MKKLLFLDNIAMVGNTFQNWIFNIHPISQGIKSHIHTSQSFGEKELEEIQLYAVTVCDPPPKPAVSPLGGVPSVCTFN